MPDLLAEGGGVDDELAGTLDGATVVVAADPEFVGCLLPGRTFGSVLGEEPCDVGVGEFDAVFAGDVLGCGPPVEEGNDENVGAIVVAAVFDRPLPGGFLHRIVVTLLDLRDGFAKTGVSRGSGDEQDYRKGAKAAKERKAGERHVVVAVGDRPIWARSHRSAKDVDFRALTPYSAG